MHREPFALTLLEYKDQLNWVRQMGWPDVDLQQVPVHEQATAGEDYLNLANFGGTALGTSSRSGGGTSADIREGIHNLYVYRREVPEHLYRQLEELSDRGGPSGYQQTGRFGEVGDSDFPPQ